MDNLEEDIDEIQVSVKFKLSQVINALKSKTETLPKSMTIDESKNNKSISYKLPEIPLPSFSGKFEEWSVFKSQFNTLITENIHLSDHQKLHYLQASLRGDAKNVQTIEETFDSLFAELEKRYENKKYISELHINAILNLDKINHESGKELHVLIDTIQKHLRGLKLLHLQPNKLTEMFLINIIINKVDKETRKQYEMSLNSTEFPKWDEFINFLEKRSQILQNVQRVFPPKPEIKYHTKQKNFMLKTKQSCPVCNDTNHTIYRCKKFLDWNVPQRITFVKSKQLCFNCLGFHKLMNCNNYQRCKFCNSKHHSLIHKTEVIKKQNGSDKELSIPNPEVSSFSPQFSRQEVISDATFASMNEKTKHESEIIPSCLFSMNNKNVLLTTAIVYIKNAYGELCKARSILDSASQINILSEELADTLGLKKQSSNAYITGLNEQAVISRKKVSAVISNASGTFKQTVDFFILPKITDVIPSKPIDVSKLNLPSHVMYADPSFNIPSKVHMILGGSIFFNLLENHQFKLENESLILQASVFGYLITGSIENEDTNKFQCHFVREETETDLKRFFDLESIGIRDCPEDADDDQALKIFNETTTFENKRYKVCFPWRKDWHDLKDNFDVAKNRLQNLCKRFQKNTELHTQYKEIILDYLQKGIIERVTDTIKPLDKPVFYLPHQAVIKRQNLTSKYRIVFDGSSHEPGELSLNDCLFKGNNLNPNILHVLINFRLNKVAILSDIQAAYLQVSLTENDRDAVRFLFSDDPSLKNLQIFRFSRVIFGINSSAFLLAATIKKHITECSENYPAAAKLIDDCMYVDDFISGQDTLENALKISCDVKEMMQGASMNLRKWLSNEAYLMKKWKELGFETYTDHKEISEANLCKVLGMLWNPVYDYLTIETHGLIESLKEKKDTKRSILQIAGRVFDPLGLLTPFTLRLKCLFQELWSRKISWDEELPADVKKTWSQWSSEVAELLNLKVQRCVLDLSDNSDKDIEIHAFSDASKKAYGAAVYLRTKCKNNVTVNLVASKSRVAPLKKISLPRLELLGALLAARLATEVKKVVDKKKQSTIQFWTDSQITLYWIKGSPRQWKSFVANRVQEIQTLTRKDDWNFIRGPSNISDLVTRGVTANALVNNEQWWKGPSFLSESDFPVQNFCPVVPETELKTELKKNFKHETNDNCSNFLNVTNDVSFSGQILKRSNKYFTILRILSYVFRFIHNTRNREKKIAGFLTRRELENAEMFLIKEIQKGEYSPETKQLEKGKNVSKSSKLASLNCFLDSNHVLRVGGRIANSNLNAYEKFPIVLPPKHPLTLMILRHYHLKLLHVGPQSLLYNVRQKYWPINGRNSCRKIVHECTTCFKNKPVLSSQIMSSLPKDRVIPNHTFNVTGIDFCGPFHVKYKNQRKGKLNKIYVCIYVCFCTRAIHLDFVTDLSSQAFIACLKRFFARRGKCAKIFTDNAGNFVKANTELKRLHKLVKHPDETLADYLTTEGIDWNFIPPKSPNFGGIWEAGVKSFKFHLKRIIGNSSLTLEEFLTVITEIEGVLNSRPLTPLSTDSDDFEVLSPGHFLIGRPITSITEPEIINVSENRLDKWSKITKFTQKIWKLWKRDYLNTLQQRNKWKFDKDDVKVGSLVLIKDENIPSTQWLIARICEIFRGSDHKIRVVNVRLPNGKILKRNVRSIAILPVE